MGQTLDPEEVFDAIEPYDTCVMGDVDSCRRKLHALEATGLDRLMCLMQFGTLRPEDALRSIEIVGKQIVPEFN